MSYSAKGWKREESKSWRGKLGKFGSSKYDSSITGVEISRERNTTLSKPVLTWLSKRR